MLHRHHCAMRMRLNNRLRLSILSTGLLLSVSSIALALPDSPVVGVLTQPHYNPRTNETEFFYVAASYVKWIELAGARAIPIPYDASSALVDEIFDHQVHGIFFPGGGSDVPEAAKHLWKRAQEANGGSQDRHHSDDFMPIWGTCLGFEYLVQLASTSTTDLLQPGYDAENISLPLQLMHLQDSLLYRDSKLQSIVMLQNVTMNNHHIGLDPERFAEDKGLTDMFVVTSTNVDRKGRPFVSTVEPRDPTRNPYYGVQYHPEKNMFEFGTSPGTNRPAEAVNHSKDSILFSFSLAQFWGDVLHTSLGIRKHVDWNPQRHPLVYDYPMKRGSEFEQVFLVPSAMHWGKEITATADSSALLRGSPSQLLQ